VNRRRFPHAAGTADHHVLPLKFVLKRTLVNNGAGFERSAFGTRPFFLSFA